jgi:hypothetical protein
MLTFGELSKIDEEIIEFIEEVEEADMLTDFYEWIELEDLGLGEDFLIEKESTAKYTQRMRKMGRQRQVIPHAIMKAKGAAGIRKRKMWKGMKAAIINRKMKPMRRQIIRDEPSRIKQARKNMTIHKKSGR